MADEIKDGTVELPPLASNVAHWQDALDCREDQLRAALLENKRLLLNQEKAVTLLGILRIDGRYEQEIYWEAISLLQSERKL